MSQFRSLNRPQFIDKLWNFFSLKKYKVKSTGVFMEFNAQLYRYPENITLERDVYLKRNSLVGSANEDAIVKIGERTTIGYNSIIMASNHIAIGSDCMIAPNVYIVDSNHGFEENKPFNLQPNVVKSVRLGNNIWLGAGVVVLPGVSICDNVIVGAGSVVTRSLLDPGIYYGTPAKKR